MSTGSRKGANTLLEWNSGRINSSNVAINPVNMMYHSEVVNMSPAKHNGVRTDIIVRSHIMSVAALA